jgi:REP element-mobilizing transposase RayT
MLFGSREKEVLRRMIHQVADFSGVEVLTFCLMGNHFHLLVKVPALGEVSDAELIRRYAVLYPKPTKYQMLSWEAMKRELQTNGPSAPEIRQRLLNRMGDVSAFMKSLKQRFSTWFNKSHDRFGPLWADRFKSVLVEGGNYTLRTMAAYIDLNPVRAGLVEDPKDYRFCGYAEAVAGNKCAAKGLKYVIAGLCELELKEVLANYRCLLFGKGAAAATGKYHIDEKRATRVLENDLGCLPSATLLRCRIRYFSEGVVLGTREFVESKMKEWRFSTNRKHAPKPKFILREEGDPIAVMRGMRGTAYSQAGG